MKRSICHRAVAVVLTSVWLGGVAGAQDTDMLIGSASSRGGAFLIKEFSVPPGAVIGGVRFHNNDRSTVFPRILLLEGPTQRIADARVLAGLDDYAPASRDLVAVDLPVGARDDWTTVYVAIELPASNGVSGPGDGTGIAAKQLDTMGTSYFASGDRGFFGRMDVEYAIELIFEGATKPGQAVPKRAAARVSPNPFNPQTVVELAVPTKGRVSIDIYDVVGRKVRRLANRVVEPGLHRERWDGHDDAGRLAATGIYFARVDIMGTKFSFKLVLAK